MGPSGNKSRWFRWDHGARWDSGDRSTLGARWDSGDRSTLGARWDSGDQSTLGAGGTQVIGQRWEELHELRYTGMWVTGTAKHCPQ